ncbi:MAG: dihydrofolate reductase [Oscillibacter sp.]|nr:dihydrofolate reductase [Oscillibacter sp.]
MIAIAAVSENGGIGRDGQLLFSLRADLKRFRELTLGHTVLLGRKTLATFPGGKCLPGRRNVVLTSDVSFAAPDAVVVHSLPEALAAAGEDAFCIGGESVYRQFLPYCGEVWLTQVLAAPPADCFFPSLEDFAEVSRSPVQEENGLSFQYVTYIRRA